MHRMLLCLIATAFLTTAAAVLAEPLGTAFTYQGELRRDGAPASGQFDLRFEPFDAGSGGASLALPVVIEDVATTDGVFTVEVDFGGLPFYGERVWLQVSVREGPDSGGFTELLPRQELTPTPYALHAQAVAIGAVDASAVQPGAIGATQIDRTQVQRRIAGTCAAGTAMSGVAQDGTPSCSALEDGHWSLAGGLLGTEHRVRIGAGVSAGAAAEVAMNSTLSSPQLELTETERDYARLSFRTVSGAEQHFWTMAARTEPESFGGPATDRINFYNSRAGDLLSLTGQGRLGIGVFSPTAALDVNGSARLRGLAFTGSGTRPLRVDAAGVVSAAAPTQRHHSVPPAAFRPASYAATYYLGADDITVQTGASRLHAPVQLPHGARITSIRYVHYDNTADQDIQFSFCRTPYSAYFETDCPAAAQFTSTGAVGAKRVGLMSGLDLTIDNLNNQYYVVAGPAFGSWDGFAINVNGVVISYTEPQD